MIIISWNIRSLGQASKQKAVRDLCAKFKPSILTLLETKRPEPDLLSVIRVWARSPCQWISRPALGASGGIWVVWNPTEHSLISYHIGDFTVTVLLSRNSDNLEWKFTSVYGPKWSSLRPRLWEELDDIAFLPHPIWCLGGDFNITRWSFERNSSNTISKSMIEFSDLISKHELIEIPLIGNQFTWSDHGAQPTQSTLDRFLVSPSWEESLTGSYALTLPIPTSDHCLILLNTQPVPRGPKPFWFELAWIQETDLASLIHLWWQSSSTYRLLNLGALHYKVTSQPPKKTQLNIIQDLDRLEESRALSPVEADLKQSTKLEFFSTLKKEELYWYQSSRVTWLKSGDLNTKFFHRVANCQQRANLIQTIKVSELLFDSVPEIEEAIISHFRNL
ncbi:hypothetical protein AMTRI_Chr11g155680 [Amborella trichopoda]